MSSSAAAASDKKAPYDLFMERLDAVQDRYPAVVGKMAIRRISREISHDEEEEMDDDSGEEDTSKYTHTQMNHVRVVFMTQSREDELENMAKLVLGSQYDHTIMLFNMRFSYQVLDSFDTFSRRFGRSKDWTKKLDMLFGFTSTIGDHDYWMHKHECGWGGEKMIAKLAKMWKQVLAKSDQELGIDAEFTRPGIICLLEDFKRQVEDVDTYGDPKMKFNYA